MSRYRCDCGSTDCPVCGGWQGTYCPDRDCLTDRCARTGGPCSDDCPDVPGDEDYADPDDCDDEADDA